MSANTTSIENEILIADVGAMAKSLQETGRLFGADCDIHRHTRELGKHCREVFFPIDARHAVSATLPLDVVIAEITEYTANNHPSMLPAIKEVLNSARGSAGKVEAETGLVISDLLVRTWALVKHPLAPDNAADLLIDNLQHNKATGGGCLAGISARLTQPYMEFIRFILAATFNQRQDLRAQAQMLPGFRRQQQLSRSAAEAAELQQLALAIEESQRFQPRRQLSAHDDELELALALSASMEHTRAAPARTVREEDLDPELAEAIRRSLQFR